MNHVLCAEFSLDSQDIETHLFVDYQIKVNSTHLFTNYRIFFILNYIIMPSISRRRTKNKSLKRTRTRRNNSRRIRHSSRGGGFLNKIDYQVLENLDQD